MSPRPVGLEAIILYKLIKAGLEALLCVSAVLLLLRGAEAGAATLAQVLLDHFTGGGALRAATVIVEGATSRHVAFVAAAALGDAILSAVEGLALQRGYWWAPWLVVAATASLLPWEVLEMLRRPGWGRVVLFVVNAAVVVYLLRGVARERRRADAGEGT